MSISRDNRKNAIRHFLKGDSKPNAPTYEKKKGVWKIIRENVSKSK